jgi:hypothetical protein
MLRRRARTLSLAALGSAAVLGLTLVGSPPASAGGDHGGGGAPKVVASDLDNPRQLSFTRSGDLYVAESGEGGSGPCLTGPEGDTVCFGTTGAITKISSRGRQSRVITGLPSIAGEGTGAQAIGPSDVAATGRSLSVLIGLGANPADRAGLPTAGQLMGTLVETKHGYRGLRTIADLAAWEAENDPVEEPDSNPVGMVVDRGRYVVADAGGNTVLSVKRSGQIRLVAEFPTTRRTERPPFIPPPPPPEPDDGMMPFQEVPTSVAARGHDGAYYVSQLTGFPFPPGQANIYRVDPRTGQTTVYASGLTNVTDLAFKGRSLYAVQLSTAGLLTVPPGQSPTGSLVKVTPGGSTHTTVAGDLDAPYGIAIKGHHAYVTVGAVAKDVGQVLRIRL